MSEPGGIAALWAEAARHMRAQQWAEAAARWRAILRLVPNRAEAWDGLGSAAYHQADHAMAEAAFRRAVALQPENANFRDHLGIALRALRQPKEAVEQYEAALMLAPENAGTLNNLGNALADADELDRAVEMLRRAVTLCPEEASFRLNLVRALTRGKRGPEALEHIEQVRAALPEPRIEVDYGHVLMQCDRHEEAIAVYRRAAAAGIRDHGMFHNLGTALQYFGRSEEAAEAYREALEIQPGFMPSRRQLTGTRKYDARDGEVEDIEKLLKASDLAAAQRAELHMGLAKICDDLGDYAKALFHLQAGNQHIRGTIDYNADDNTDFIDAVIETFDSDFFAARRGFGLDSDVPVFVIGMPRSGTTLVEQILASHRDAFGAGELKKLYDLFVGLRQTLTPDLGLPRIARLIDRAVAADLAKQYLAYLTDFAPQARRVVDKMPFNFRMLGLISLLFPNARIIHCRRDPRDVGLSCYFARFHDELSFAFNLVEIGRYYGDYARLMTHWQKVINNPIIEVQYEKLVANQEGETRRILDFCGLDWDEHCLRFYETERAVLTASNWQVRQPVYASSAGRWRHYEAGLEPLIAALEPCLESAAHDDFPPERAARVA